MKHHDGNCRELLLRMAQGLEGDLTPAERRALARHLAGCERCLEFSESLKRTVQLCHDAGAPPMSAHARARARANVSRLLPRPASKTAKVARVPRKRT